MAYIRAIALWIALRVPLGHLNAHLIAWGLNVEYRREEDA